MKRFVLVVCLPVIAALMVLPSAMQSASAATCRSLEQVTLSRSSVVGGNAVTGTVYLRCKVRRSATVRLAAFTGVNVPTSVTVPRFQRKVSFTVRTSRTTVTRRGTVKAYFDGVRRPAGLTVRPRCVPALSGLTVPTLLHAGDNATGKVTLSCAPSAATTISLDSDKPNLTVPSTVTVPGGQASVGVPISVALANGAQYPARVTAHYAGKSLARDTVVNPGLKLMEISPSSAVNSMDVSVLFTGPAPTGGLTVKLASNSPAVTVPPTAFFPSGAYGGTVPGIQVQPVSEDTAVTISVTLGRRTLTDSKVLLAPFDGSGEAHLSAPESGDLYGLQSWQQYDLRLDAPAPEGGLEVSFTVRDGNPAVQLESTSGYIGEGRPASRSSSAPLTSPRRRWCSWMRPWEA